MRLLALCVLGYRFTIDRGHPEGENQPWGREQHQCRAGGGRKPSLVIGAEAGVRRELEKMMTRLGPCQNHHQIPS